MFMLDFHTIFLFLCWSIQSTESKYSLHEWKCKRCQVSLLTIFGLLNSAAPPLFDSMSERQRQEMKTPHQCPSFYLWSPISVFSFAFFSIVAVFFFNHHTITYATSWQWSSTDLKHERHTQREWSIMYDQTTSPPAGPTVNSHGLVASGSFHLSLYRTLFLFPSLLLSLHLYLSRHLLLTAWPYAVPVLLIQSSTAKNFYQLAD